MAQLALASGSWFRTIKLWEVAKGREKATLIGHLGPPLSVSFSPDGATLASGSYDKTIKLWDVETGREKATLRGHTLPVTSVSFSPDGATLASGSEDPAIKLWGVATGREIATLRGHPLTVTSVSFSPDGKTLASGSWDQTIKLWDIATGREKATLEGHAGYVSSVSFSPDGKTLASGSWDQTIKLWEIATGREKATLEGHAGDVSSVSFSPDGATLASGSDDKTIKLWDAAFESITMKQAIRFTGSQLKDFDVVPLPAHTYIARQDFVGVKGFTFAPSPQPPPEENPFLKMQWSKRNPNHWIPGARRGEAKCLYHLAIICERQKRDDEAWELHLKATAVTDPAQKEWAEKSKWRLENMPWLKAQSGKDGK